MKNDDGLDEFVIAIRASEVLADLKVRFPLISDIERLAVLRSSASIIENIISTKSLVFITAKYLNKE